MAREKYEKVKLTKRNIDAAQPGQKDRFLSDTEIPGYLCKITPKGRKVFLLTYRMGGRSTKPTKHTIGRLGDWTPDGARTEAERLRGLIAAGTDPAIEKKNRTARSTTTVDAIFADYCKRHVEAQKLRRGAATIRALKCHVFLHRQRYDFCRGHVRLPIQLGHDADVPSGTMLAAIRAERPSGRFLPLLIF